VSGTASGLSGAAPRRMIEGKTQRGKLDRKNLCVGTEPAVGRRAVRRFPVPLHNLTFFRRKRSIPRIGAAPSGNRYVEGSSRPKAVVRSPMPDAFSLGPTASSLMPASGGPTMFGMPQSESRTRPCGLCAVAAASWLTAPASDNQPFPTRQNSCTMAPQHLSHQKIQPGTPPPEYARDAQHIGLWTLDRAFPALFPTRQNCCATPPSPPPNQKTQLAHPPPEYAHDAFLPVSPSPPLRVSASPLASVACPSPPNYARHGHPCPCHPAVGGCQIKRPNPVLRRPNMRATRSTFESGPRTSGSAPLNVWVDRWGHRLAPLRGAIRMGGPCVRWCRCARPPAKGCEPAGFGEGGSAGASPSPGAASHSWDGPSSPTRIDNMSDMTYCAAGI
jgi:hypothetical protein